MKEKDIPLTLERMSDERDKNLITRSKNEIHSILHTIQERNTRVALYFNNKERVFLTMIVALDSKGFWLDATPNHEDHEAILDSDEVICVSVHNNAKVQFPAGPVAETRLDGSPAYWMALPEKLLRLQRREYFRIPTPIINPLKCIIQADPEKPETAFPFTVVDISVGGIGLVCKPEENFLTQGVVYQKCRIDLPEIGEISVDLEVRNGYEMVNRKGDVSRRIGCAFIKLDGKTNMLLQRYVAMMQRQALISMTDD